MIPTYLEETIPVISFAPNWGAGMKWGQAYLTTITEALSTREERQGRQPRPLYRLTFSTVGLSARETAYLRDVIQTAEDLPVACPLWPCQTRLTTAANATDTSLDLDTTEFCMFEVFHEFAILWESFDQWEIVELDAVTANGATLLAGLANSYSESAMLVPIAYGHVPRGPVEQLTDEHGVWRVEFRETFHRLHDQSIPEDVPDLDVGIFDLFDYALGQVSSTAAINGGPGWADQPNISPNRVASVASDYFEDYSLGSFVQLARGIGWAAPANLGLSYHRIVCRDTMETYDEGAITAPEMTDGDGWAGAPDISTNA